MSKEFFNARANTWDETAAEKNADKLNAMAARLEIAPGSAVLDVGTGTGVFVPYLLRKIGPEGSLVCLDYAEEMLKAARAKHFPDNVGFHCAAIEDSGLETGAFDAVVCYSVFPHFHDHAKALKEIYRVLKREGNVFICHTSSRDEINNIHRNIREIRHHLFPGNEDMRRMLKEAGFAGIMIVDGKNDYLASGKKTGC